MLMSVNKNDVRGAGKMTSDKEKVIINSLMRCSINKLIDLWEETDKRQITQEVVLVRGWIMTALEAKDPEAFDAWNNAVYTTPESGNPAIYYLKAVAV